MPGTTIKTRTSGIMIPAFVAPAAGAAATTWNSSDKSANIVLSNGNLTAKSDDGANVRSVRSVASVGASAKIYYEILVDTLTASNLWIGFAKASFNLNGAGIGGTSPSDSFGGDVGNVQYQDLENGAEHGSAWASSGLSAGQRAGIAYDVANAKIWLRKNGGVWNNLSSADPATNVGGFNVIDTGGSGSLYAAVTIGFATNDQATARFSSASWQDAAPSGFTALS